MGVLYEKWNRVHYACSKNYKLVSWALNPQFFPAGSPYNPQAITFQTRKMEDYRWISEKDKSSKEKELEVDQYLKQQENPPLYDPGEGPPGYWSHFTANGKDYKDNKGEGESKGKGKGKEV
ncbi:hypothetical protein ABW19_dt0208373 [Dactylella cylindrospora]|nr:hypothetical protein ABW19_dt0208373 [Dactylella cylindrospora]